VPIKFLNQTFKKKLSKKSQNISEPGFDPETCGLWATTLPLRHSDN